MADGAIRLLVVMRVIDEGERGCRTARGFFSILICQNQVSYEVPNPLPVP
jgi:hypothetical protein